MVVHGWPGSQQGRLLADGPWSSPDGPKGRLRMAQRVVSGCPQGRLRMARGSPFKPSTDGGSSEAGRRRCTIAHQDGSEGRLLEVGCLRIAQPVSVLAVSSRELTGPGAVDTCWAQSFQVVARLRKNSTTQSSRTLIILRCQVPTVQIPLLQLPTVQTVQKTVEVVEIPQLQILDKVVDMAVAMQNPLETPQLQISDMPVVFNDRCPWS